MIQRKLVILVPFLEEFEKGGTPIRIAGYTKGLREVIDYTFVSTIRPSYISEECYQPLRIHRRWSKIFLLHNLLRTRFLWIARCVEWMIERFSGIQGLNEIITPSTIIWAHQEQTIALYLYFTRGTEIIYDVHGIYNIQREYSIGLSAYRKWWFERSCHHESILFYYSNYINVVSTEMRDFIIAHFNPQGKILIAPDGIPHELRYYQERQPIDLSNYRINNRKIALFVGNFKPIGGVIELLQEYFREYVINKQFMLIMIGGGPSKKQMEDLIAPRGDVQVCLIPPMPHEELVGYMKAADVIICPDPIENKYNQVTPHIKLYDAVVSGTPVVATDIKVNKDLFPEGERVVYYTYRDGSFSKAMMTAIKLPHAIDEELSKYTYSARLKQYLETYRAMLKI